ncbi:hypothetical protein [Streptomyces sp. NPDC047973]|uniref:hypothetical protein n=1 Tax=Streptomyces sp. NPDC047973 TaxID=3155383 RepID=UPI00343403AC
MSNSDQQYPYDPGYGQQDQRYPGHGQPHHDPAAAAPSPGQEAPAQGQQAGYGQQQAAYGQGSGYGQPAYGQQQSPAYGNAGYGQPPAYGGPDAGYGQQQQSEYGGHASYGQPAAGYPEPGAQQAAGDQGVTQTWQGQTWDTQYQPTIQPQPQPQPQVYSAGTPAPGYGAPAAHPLPPEAPAAAAARPAPEAAVTGISATDTSGYGAPTTLGNSRITDAQRARAEGRSPIIAPGMQPAAITAGLGLLLALGAAVGSYALLVPVVLLQAVTAAGWFRLNGMWPARQGIALAFAGGVVADAVLLAAGRSHAPAAMLGTLGVWVLLTLVLQLRSHAGADERMYGLTATVVSAALAVLAAGHLAAAPDAVTAGAIAVAVAVLVRALPLPGPVSVVVSLLASAGAGLAAAAVTGFGAEAALLGFAAGGCALIGLRVASYDYPSRFVHMTAGVALPLTAAAPAVYLIGRAIV